ncbi:MAG: carboxypeptidase regulatory-like domain-containing protein [Proteobacteria bacterium]|nr:carboxypeptidase regulatory-like domain-containing protein [Pseudomonadota bacterium]
MAALALTTACAAQAQTMTAPAPVMPAQPAAAPAAPMATGGMPRMRGEGNARYVCGGIGSDESTAMRAAMKDHPLSLLFARPDGAYLANVEVDIKGDSGSALRLRANGPVCLIDLPAGKYTVDASTEGRSKSQSVTLGGGPRTLDFRF